jgi:translation initiation factor RLI1
MALRQGMNRFLEQVDVTFRRDHESHRPRINKPGSRKDREQKTTANISMLIDYNFLGRGGIGYD